MPRDTSTRFTRLVGCEVPIQLAPIGAAGQVPRLSLAVTRAGGHAMYPGVLLSAPELAGVLRPTHAAAGSVDELPLIGTR